MEEWVTSSAVCHWHISVHLTIHLFLASNTICFLWDVKWLPSINFSLYLIYKFQGWKIIKYNVTITSCFLTTHDFTTHPSLVILNVCLFRSTECLNPLKTGVLIIQGEIPFWKWASNLSENLGLNLGIWIMGDFILGQWSCLRKGGNKCFLHFIANNLRDNYPLGFISLPSWVIPSFN